MEPLSPAPQCSSCLGRGLGKHAWRHPSVGLGNGLPATSGARTASPSPTAAVGCAQAGLSPAGTQAVGHSWHLCWRTSVRWMLPQLRFHLPWPLPWRRRDLHLLGSKVQDAHGTPNASWGADPSCSGVVCSWPSNTGAALPPPWGLTPPSPVRLMRHHLSTRLSTGMPAAPAAEPRQSPQPLATGTVPMAAGGDGWTWRTFSQVSHDAGDTTVPQRGLNRPRVAGTDSPAKRCWSFAVQPHSPVSGPCAGGAF